MRSSGCYIHYHFDHIITSIYFFSLTTATRRLSKRSPLLSAIGHKTRWRPLYIGWSMWFVLREHPIYDHRWLRKVSWPHISSTCIWLFYWWRSLSTSWRFPSCSSSSRIYKRNTPPRRRRNPRQMAKCMPIEGWGKAGVAAPLIMFVIVFVFRNLNTNKSVVDLSF